ncbi:hypothetical protein COS75_01845 [Candidatus Pacearchaeota archaeon CG06_land_8_20_14_3_00_35_12]|nr:MAG: hypothetical protein COS75_01845 [Candidatus Pacearchaeota archaeon CG06_land_8_20_14_3_00_35_12]
MIKILGAADMAVAVFFLLLGLKIAIPKALILGFALYLIIKGAMFITDIVSILDLAVGVIMILFYFAIIPSAGIISFVCAVFLAQKAFFSLV